MDEAFLNDLLECSVCLEQLDGNSKVLPCQHTFCKRCLEEIVHSHKELRCPECRILVEIKVDELPPNILLMRLLEGIKNNPRLKPMAGNVASKKSVETTSSTQPLSPPRASQVHSRPDVAERPKSVPKQSLHTPPFAKAMYTYEGKEPGDLTFKKGDMIILQRRIDQNWYHGEVNGKYGFVPARYVRVVVPLPTHVPQCKALYDFSVSEKEEKDCLTFKKGEVITVIRRVDDNWAEGKLGDRIGIYPISFVEMNVAARSLMKLSANSQQGPSRVAPPTPSMTSSQIPMAPHSKSNVSLAIPLAKVTESLSSTTTSPSPSSSTTPSPSTPPSSSNSSPSVPNASTVSSVTSFDHSPSVLTRSASQRVSHPREKRHSLSSISSSSSVSQKSPHIPITHKHSLEILSTAGGDVLAAPNNAVADNPVSTKNATAPIMPTPVSTKNSQKEDIAPPSTQQHYSRSDFPKVTAAATTSTTMTVTVSKGTSSTTNSTPGAPTTFYVALYNYRPQKEDELELKKGEFYTVSEKCQDGWFKGNGLNSTRSGVFPGNYVHIASKSHASPYASVANIRSKSMLPVASIPPRQKSSPVVQSVPTSGLSSGTYMYSSKQPAVQEPMTSVAASLFEWARSVTVPSGSQATNSNYMPSSLKQENITSTYAPNTKSSDIVHWVSSLSTTQTSVVSTTLAPMSMTGSYPSASSHHNNLSVSCTPSSISQSWHAGKSPSSSFVPTTSVSVVPPPNVSLKASSSASGHSSHGKSDKHKIRKEKTRESLMKRFTGKKKTSISAVNYSCDNPSFIDSPTQQTSNSVVHVRSGSCPSEALTGHPSGHSQANPVETVPTEAPKSSSRIKQPPLARERFRCVVPYPPNSEYELELKVGDVVYVHKKREDGWYKGTLQRTGKTGLFPASFVDNY